MNQQNLSPLDSDPIYSRIIELIKKGETNTSLARTISKEYNSTVSESAIRRFRKRHNVPLTPTTAATPVTVVSGDNATAITSVSQHPSGIPIESDTDEMLRERGLDPGEWSVDTILSSEWGDLTGSGSGLVNQQTKFTAKRLRPELILNPVRSQGWTPEKSHLVERLVSQARKDHELVVICGDQQAPFHDKKLHEAFCLWLAKNKPSRGVILGDLLDFPDVSRHPADPDNTASVQECLQVGFDIVRDYIESSPYTQWEFLLGNHDIRIQRYIIDKAPNVHNIARVVDKKHPEPEFVHALTHLMRLDELGVHVVTTNGGYEDAQVVLSDKLAVRHGWKVNQGSGATALKTLQQTGYSIIIGHVHRQSIVYHTVHDINRQPTTLVAAEAGCMCRLDGNIDDTGRRFPSYSVLPDWQNGFMTARVYKDGKFHLSPAIYVNETLLWEDQRYEGNYGQEEQSAG